MHTKFEVLLQGIRVLDILFIRLYDSTHGNKGCRYTFSRIGFVKVYRVYKVYSLRLSRGRERVRQIKEL